MKDVNIELLTEGYLAGKSCKQLTICKILKKANVPLRKKWDHKTLKVPFTNLSNTHKQIIEGCLLGDGSVICRQITPHFTLTSIHEEFVKHLSSSLPFPRFRYRHRESCKRKISGAFYDCKDSYGLSNYCR